MQISSSGAPVTHAGGQAGRAETSKVPSNGPFDRHRRVSLYGCGVVAPGAANVREFLEVIHAQTVTLEASSDLAGMFRVGNPKFSFEACREWIAARHNVTRFAQLAEKGGPNVQTAIGATIDALQGNPDLEGALKALDPRVMICIGTGFGDVKSAFVAHDEYTTALAAWNRFWAAPERNAACAAYQNAFLKLGQASDHVPADPIGFEIDSPERANAWTQWNAYWAPKSEGLQTYLAEFATLEAPAVGADVAHDKLNLIRSKAKAKKALQARFGAPTAPWDAVNPNFLWNIPNTPAAQISMLLGVHGVASASIGACATFGLVLRQALDGIRSGAYDAAIVGTADVPPPPEVTAGFYAAKVLAAGPTVCAPLSEMRGTHVSGGACVWILAADEAMAPLGVKHMGVELLGAGLSSDAEHIITPSAEGPKHCIREAFAQCGLAPAAIGTWDLHATGTPGDWSELKLIEEFVPAHAVLTARKGLFGHGMSTCGGWELTAQVLGLTRESSTRCLIAPSGVAQSGIHPSIVAMGRRFAADAPAAIDVPNGQLVCGKLSMGIGGLSSCVLTRVTL